MPLLVICNILITFFWKVGSSSQLRMRKTHFLGGNDEILTILNYIVHCQFTLVNFFYCALQNSFAFPTSREVSEHASFIESKESQKLYKTPCLPYMCLSELKYCLMDQNFRFRLTFDFIYIGVRFALIADSHSELWLPEFPGCCLPFQIFL